MGNIDWAKLVHQGRAKNFGVPWTEEENYAVSVLHIPADYVRRGCVTLESYGRMSDVDTAKIEKTGKIPLTQCKKERLEQLALEYGVNFTQDATRAVLIEELKNSGCPNQVEV